MTRASRYVLGVLIATSLLAGLLVLPWGRWALLLVDWIRGAGAVGAGVFAVAYVAATLLLLPGSMLTAGAGFAYGPLWGTLLVSPASVLGATLAFLLGRGMARAWVARRIEKHPRFRAIDEAVAERGFKVVLLLRLSPVVPFNLLNYALGLTRVRVRDYVIASLVGMLPGTLLYVYLGSLVTSVSGILAGAHPAAGAWGEALYWGGLAATLLVIVVITRTARTTLSQVLERKQGPEVPASSQARS